MCSSDLQGQIHLVLRNPVDYEVVKVEAMNTRTVLGMAPEKQVTRQRPTETKKPEPKPAPVVVAPPPAPKPDPSFTVIRGGNISKQNSPTGEKP